MKPNVIIALLVGGVVGFAVGRMASGTPGGSPGGNQPTAAAPSNPSPAAPAARPSGGGDDQAVYKVTLDSAPVRGNEGALVTIVEFSDYQCPFCSRAHNTVKQLEQDYGQKLRVVMKQNPLSFHPFAKPAATAALAAGAQGKYWEMHDKMFANQQNLDEASLEKYAQEIGLNLEKWKTDRNAQSVSDQISHDQGQAASLGANGTPAFFINGRKLSGAQPIDRFKALIDEEVGKAQSLVNQGTPAKEVYAKTIERGMTAPAPAPAPSQPQAPAAPPPAAVRNVKVPDDAPAKGPKTAKVTIVAWSDFQCPFCSRVVPTLKQIEDTYAKDVRVVFRNQPLPFHQNAKPAAEAAMAAHEQGKFWPMHDKLFANQQALDRASIEKYGQEIGLDMGKFKAALDSGKFRARVEADSAAGNEVGANGTPTFFINGREFVGAQPFESFKAMIDEEIKHADKILASGVKPGQLYEKLIEDGIKNAPAAPAAQPGQPAAPAPVANIDINGSPVIGAKNAPVTIVAFSDFQCPFCSRAVPTLKELEKQYEGKIKVAFKNQPLPFHQNARPAAMAGMAAHEQGKFWEMHDKIFANQQQLDRATYERYAQELGLDMGKFKAALDSNKFDAQITKDSNDGTAIGANGTPTFFINGRQLVGAQPIEQFKTIIDDELAKKKK
ncbi:MAG: thioredoxin domain-containing protein [Archangiaceae bacterium]|nr:thioredoxin domain-containing protein [Archangiaceae bacterium]